jgi:protoheme IX farnesyltransferase
MPADFSKVRPYFSLLKLPLSTTIAASALGGYLIQNAWVAPAALQLFTGVLALACGCAGLNNVQDRYLDARLERTRTRPIPAGEIAPAAALAVSAFLACLGLGLLFASGQRLGWLGILAVACYNLLYTPLKPRTQWALLPGVVCGMLPPWMGWLAAGGQPFSVTIWMVMVIFGVWQLPHFWLLVLAHRTDYRAVGLPTLLRQLSTTQADRVLLVWASGLAFLTLCLPLGRLIQTDAALVALTLNAIWLIVVFGRRVLSTRQSPSYRRLFTHLNLAVFFTLAIAVAEQSVQALP